MKRVLKETLYMLVIVMLLVIGGFCGFKVFSIMQENHQVESKQEETKLVVDEEKTEKTDEGKKIEEYKEKFQKMKDYNKDFQGWLVFDSGIINLPFVKGKDNDEYLRKDMDGNYSIFGTVFLDAEDDYFARNLTLYGHMTYSGDGIMFGPLDDLRDAKNYEKNKNFSLFLEDEQRKYEVAAVFIYYMDSGIKSYYQYPNLEDEEWHEYLDFIKNNKLYETGVEINEDDNLIALQTCFKNNKNRRIIVVGREIERELII